MRCAEESESGSPRISSSALDPRPLGEAVDLAVQDLAERAADHALRLERVRDLAELAIELDEPRREVVEAPVRLLAVVLEDERIDLLLEQLDVRCERKDVLNRAVVEVEAEAHQTTLRGGDERPLAARGVVEEVLALDDVAQGGGDLEQVRVRDALLRRADAPDDGGIRLAEAKHGRGSKLGAAEERQTRALPQRRLRLGSRAATRASVAAEHDDAVEPAGRADPERDVGEHVEPEQQAELELDRHERRKLEHARVSDDLAEEDVPRGREGERTGLGDRRAGAAHVGLVELERRAELDDRGRGVPDRCEPVADLVVARTPRERAARR